MKELLSIVCVGYAILMGLSMLSILINLEKYRANYHNPHNPMQQFSFGRVIGLKVVMVIVALAIASSLNLKLFG